MHTYTYVYVVPVNLVYLCLICMPITQGVEPQPIIAYTTSCYIAYIISYHTITCVKTRLPRPGGSGRKSAESRPIRKARQFREPLLGHVDLVLELKGFGPLQDRGSFCAGAPPQQKGKVPPHPNLKPPICKGELLGNSGARPKHGYS